MMTVELRAIHTGMTAVADNVYLAAVGDGFGS